MFKDFVVVPFSNLDKLISSNVYIFSISYFKQKKNSVILSEFYMNQSNKTSVYNIVNKFTTYFFNQLNLNN